MGKLSKFEVWTLLVTAAFLLLSIGWFVLQRHSPVQVQVTTAPRSAEAADGAEERVVTQPSRPKSMLEGERIDINRADVGELQRLPGIGEKRAQAIVEYRQQHGQFQRVEDLLQVSGVGEGILAGLADYITIEADQPAA